MSLKSLDGGGRRNTKNGILLDAPSSPRAMRYSSSSLKDVVCHLADSHDNEAWEEFVCRIGKHISLRVKRTAFLWGGASRELVQDLVQETYVKLLGDGCRHLQDFAIQHPDDAILGYIKTTAANATHDYLRKRRKKSDGGDILHVSLSDVDPEAGKQVDGSEARIDLEVYLKEIDEHLKHCLTGPDPERDRTIFWLYFRQGMSTKEIASLPIIGLTAKGVGSVIERLKHGIREQIVGVSSDSDDDKE